MGTYKSQPLELWLAPDLAAVDLAAYLVASNSNMGFMLEIDGHPGMILEATGIHSATQQSFTIRRTIKKNHL